jgi:hypothetical protein
MPEIHSTASEGAVSRTNKFGESMPILRPHPLGGFHVDHNGNRMGQIWQSPDGKWWSGKPYEPGIAHPHESKHEAAQSLFTPIDPARGMV